MAVVRFVDEGALPYTRTQYDTHVDVEPDARVEADNGRAEDDAARHIHLAANDLRSLVKQVSVSK